MIKTWFEIDDKFIPATYLAMPLIDLALNRQVKINSLLKGTGIFYDDLNNTKLKLSCQQLHQLLYNAQKNNAKNDFGFLVGRRLMSFIGNSHAQLLLNCNNLKQMIRVVKCYQSLIFPMLHFNIEQNKNQTYFIIESAINSLPAEPILLEVFLSAINASVKWQFNRQIPFHFYFLQARPNNIVQYEENLGHRLHFNSQQNMFVIDNHWLEVQFDDASKLTKKQHFYQSRILRKSLAKDHCLIQRIDSLIQKKPHNSRLEKVAKTLGLSPATLKRKLKKHSTNFQTIQDTVKKRKAVYELSVNKVSNQTIANHLQFNDLNNFRRAFKRWTGMTPSEFKAIK